MKDTTAQTVIFFILLANTFTMAGGAINDIVPLQIALGVGVSNICAAGLTITLTLRDK